MSKKTPGIKIPYFRAEQYPVVEGLRCVEILIPDTIENMALLAGLLKLPGRSFNWQGDDEKRYELAQSWRVAYDATDWEQCMNCEELQACLAPLLADQLAAIQAMINESKYGTPDKPGLPMTNTQRGIDLAAGTNPTCDLNITWAQCEQIIKYGDSLIKAALAIAETATNDVELAAAISQIPGLDELGVDAVFGYISVIQDGIAENYTAQATPEYIEEAQCALFCLCKGDCQITADRIYEVFKTRVLAHFEDPLEIFLTIVDLMSYLLDQDIDGSIIADVLMLVVFGGGVLAQVFLGDVGTKELGLLLKLAVNDANNDWEFLCISCPECTLWNRDNVAAWSFTDDGEADAPDWRLADAGNDMIGAISGLSITGMSEAIFTWMLDSIDVVSYSYIRVITDVGTYAYSGAFTGTLPVQRAVIAIPDGETVTGLEYHILGATAASEYYLNRVEVCP